MKRAITAIWKLFHIHKFKTTHTNKWMIPTRQECRCGLTRAKSSEMPVLGVWLEWWEYSDGTQGPKESVFEVFK